MDFDTSASHQFCQNPFLSLEFSTRSLQHIFRQCFHVGTLTPHTKSSSFHHTWVARGWLWSYIKPITGERRLCWGKMWSSCSISYKSIEGFCGGNRAPHRYNPSHNGLCQPLFFTPQAPGHTAPIHMTGPRQIVAWWAPTRFSGTTP